MYQDELKLQLVFCVWLTDADVSITTLQHFVHALGPQGRPQNPCNRLCSLNVSFLSINASDPLFLLLLLWSITM